MITMHIYINKRDGERMGKNRTTEFQKKFNNIFHVIFLNKVSHIIRLY